MDWRYSRFTRHHNLLTAAEPITGPIVKNGRTAGKKVGRVVGGASDPDFASVVLLVGADGTDGSTIIPDESGASKGNATRVPSSGSVEIDTAQSKFGGSSLLNTSNAYCHFGDSPDWVLTGDFTIEAWVRATDTGTRGIIGQWSAGSGRNFALYRSSSNQLVFFMSSTGSGAAVTLTPTWTDFAIDTWMHVAVDRSGNTFRLYSNGVMLASATASFTGYDSALDLEVGRVNGTGEWHGWIDELRITNGVARYASDSGYTVPAAAFPRS